MLVIWQIREFMFQTNILNLGKDEVPITSTQRTASRYAKW
jgi:hypothetical protein